MQTTPHFSLICQSGEDIIIQKCGASRFCCSASGFLSHLPCMTSSCGNNFWGLKPLYICICTQLKCLFMFCTPYLDVFILPLCIKHKTFVVDMNLYCLALVISAHIYLVPLLHAYKYLVRACRYLLTCVSLS